MTDAVPIKVAIKQNTIKALEESMKLTTAEARAQRNCFYGFCYRVVASVWFNFCVYLLIFANTLTLALYRYD